MAAAEILPSKPCCTLFCRTNSSPIVIAGGKKLPELDTLDMAYKAIDQGASGVDTGRNIFQVESLGAMIQVVGAMVHDNEKPAKAFNMYETLKSKSLNPVATS